MLDGRGFILFACALAATVGCQAKTEPFRDGGLCPARGYQLPADVESRCVCRTSSNGAGLWGTAQYTGDSDVCRAARHAGVIDHNGGTVVVRRSAGCSTYRGSLRNTQSSSTWGVFSSSFYFPGASDGSCQQRFPGEPLAVAAPPPPPTTVGQTPDPGAASWGSAPAGQIRLCPRVLPAIGDGSAMRGTCSCGAPIGAGPVWGSGPYALDSDLCAAALHAGAIDPAGGAIEVEIVSGCARYAGGDGAHGVHGRASEGTPWAFTFAGRVARCPSIDQ